MIPRPRLFGGFRFEENSNYFVRPVGFRVLRGLGCVLDLGFTVIIGLGGLGSEPIRKTAWK